MPAPAFKTSPLPLFIASSVLTAMTLGGCDAAVGGPAEPNGPSATVLADTPAVTLEVAVPADDQPSAPVERVLIETQEDDEFVDEAAQVVAIEAGDDSDLASAEVILAEPEGGGEDDAVKLSFLTGPCGGDDVCTAIAALPPGNFDAPSSFHHEVAGATSSGYSSAWSTNRNLGFYPVAINAASNNYRVRWSGIWHQRDESVDGWSSWRGLTYDPANGIDAYRDKWRSLSRQGYVVTDLSGHDYKGRTYFSGTWIKGSQAPPTKSWRNLSRSTMTKLLAKDPAAIAAKGLQGYRPKKISAYRLGDSLRFATVWVKDGFGSNWHAHLGLSSSQYSSRWSQHRASGHRLVEFAAYRDGGLKYAGVWAKGVGTHGWASYRNMSAESFRARRIQMRKANYRLEDVDAYYPYAGSNTIRFSGIWVRHTRRNALRSNLGLPSSNPHIAQLKTLLAGYSGNVGFYVDDLETGSYIAYNPHEHYYMASVAKTFIAGTVLDQVDRGHASLDDTLTFRSSDYLQNQTALESSDIGSAFTLDQYIAWMINLSNTNATDRLAGFVGQGGLDDYLIDDLGMAGQLGQVTSICQVDKRIASDYSSCVWDVPCNVFERWWRNNVSNATHQSCLNKLKGKTTSQVDRAYDRYYDTLANAVTPAGMARYYRRLLRLELMDEANRNRFVEILDATGNGYVDDNIINRGYFSGAGGKHGGKRKVRSWSGLTWYRNGSSDISDATFTYSISIFTEDWASSGDDDEAKEVIKQALGYVLAYLDSKK